MERAYYKHYITVDARGRVTDAWSDGPLPDKDVAGAICVNDRGGYQFRLSPDGEENPILYTRDLIPRYKYEGGQVVERSKAEIAADRSAIPPPPPTATERLEAQVTYTAMMTDTLI